MKEERKWKSHNDDDDDDDDTNYMFRRSPTSYSSSLRDVQYQPIHLGYVKTLPRSSMADRTLVCLRTTLLACDRFPRPLVYVKEKTFTGVATTFGFVAICSTVLTVFIVLYAKERTIGTERVATQDKLYVVDLQCVSNSGCNTTYLFDVNTPCAALVSSVSERPLGTVRYYAENTTIRAAICRSRDYREGLLVTSLFDYAEQVFVRPKKTWILELAHPGYPHIPLATVQYNNRLSLMLTRSAVVDRTDEDKILGVEWDIGGSDVSVAEPTCPDLTFFPNLFCGGYLIRPPKKFDEDVVQRSLSLSFVAASVSGITSLTLVIFKCFTRVKVFPSQLREETKDENEPSTLSPIDEMDMNVGVDINAISTLDTFPCEQPGGVELSVV